MPDYPKQDKLPLTQQYPDTKLYCPICGRIAGYFTNSQKYLYIVHNPKDICYQEIGKQVGYGSD